MAEVKPKKQSLSLSQMHNGFMMALEQAEHLAEESQILASRNLFAGALSKAILGLEEIGKNRLLLYQAGVMMMGIKAPWKQFWSFYRSHTKKLEMAIQWATILDPALLSVEDVKAHLKLIIEEAVRLDKRKQESQYVGFDGNEFKIPKDCELKVEATAIKGFLQSLCIQLREQYPAGLPEEQFKELVVVKVQLSRALNLVETEAEPTPDGLAEAIADGNSEILTLNGLLPSVRTFEKRVKERYEIVPPKIQVTLNQLNSDSSFEAFYNAIKTHYGYPDWVILSTIFNISLNARVKLEGQSQLKPDEVQHLMNWAEQPEDEPLPIETFTNEKEFNIAMDMWLAAFLVGLGIAIPGLTAKNMKKVRRVASRYYSVFEYDVEHWPIFNFCGVSPDGE